MAFRPIQVTPRVEQGSSGKKGGGGLGQVLGAVGGAALAGGAAAAAPATGGATLPIAAAALGGAGGGAGLGQLVGEQISPTKQGSGAMERRLATTMPMMDNSGAAQAKIRDSLVALQSQPPQVQQQYAQPLVNAYLKAGAGVA